MLVWIAKSRFLTGFERIWGFETAGIGIRDPFWIASDPATCKIEFWENTLGLNRLNSSEHMIRGISILLRKSVRLYKPVARKPCLTVYRAHAGLISRRSNQVKVEILSRKVEKIKKIGNSIFWCNKSIILDLQAEIIEFSAFIMWLVEILNLRYKQ